MFDSHYVGLLQVLLLLFLTAYIRNLEKTIDKNIESNNIVKKDQEQLKLEFNICKTEHFKTKQ